MSMELEAPNLTEFVQAVDKLDEKVRKQALKRTLEAGSGVVAAGIGKVAPRSKQPRSPSGRQGWRTGKHAAENVKRSTPRVTEFDASTTVGWETGANDPYFYMKFSEFGRHYSRVGFRANPFMEFGLQQSEGEAMAAMERILKEELGFGG
jgi:HK97 gp10 family phage protein